jgi:uncharacterized protein YfaS (alpha-2-macroglobulin family)
MEKRFFIIVLSCLIQYGCAQNNPIITMSNFNYEKAWAQVKEHEDKGLPESARKVVEEIYAHAKQDKHTGQLVKAVVHKLKFADYKEENAFAKNLIKLKQEADSASFPEKPLLHSMLGEMYWQYYQHNRYRFNNRTETTNFDNLDIETWTLDKIVQETFNQYQLSLQYEKQSKETPVSLYVDVLQNGNDMGRSFRPTLYDFLAHRALDFYIQDEPAITKPAYSFSLDRDEYLSDAERFSELNLTSRDSLSMKFSALKILQDLIRFHYNDRDRGALVEVDLQRLQFVRQHFTGAGKNDLYLKALESLEKKVIDQPVSTRVTFQKAQLYSETASQYKPLQSEAHKWDYKTADEICNEAKKRFPDSPGAIMCENLQLQINQKSISAVIEDVNLPNEAFRSLIHYRNFTELHYRIIKTTRDEIRAQRKKWQRNYDVNQEEKFIEYYAGKNPLKSGKHTLPDDKDFQAHSIEVKLDALSEGEYIVLFSNNPQFSTEANGMAYGFTVVSNISYIHRLGKDNGTEFYVLHRKSGEPLSGVKADVYSNQYNYKKSEYDAVKVGTYTTDANGYFVVPFIKNENRRDFFVNFTLKQDFNSTEVPDRGYHGGGIYQYEHEPRHTYARTFFFLDRAIYRPGQTIYFKGIVIDTDENKSTIRKKYNTSITLFDVNYQQRAEINVTTNEYGTFSGTFTAPTSGLTGEMRVVNSDGSGEISFSVEEYKRPKFEVVIEPVKSTFRLGEKIKAEGYARAYSGANIDGASVSYRVVRAARFPFWWWCRWGYWPTSPEVEITNGATTTDADGKFTVDFEAIPDLSVERESDPTFDFIVYADVTDINGETHSTSSTVSVGYKALLVNVPINDINRHDPKQAEKEYSIVTTNTAGEFQAAAGKIRIFALKAPGKPFRKRMWEQPDRKLYTREEFYSLFPHDVYADEANKFKWERDKAVLETDFNTANSKTFRLTNLNRWSPGEYVLEITSKDKYGQDVKEVAYFTVFDPTAKSIPVPEVHYMREVKLTAEPSENASFIAGTADGKIKVLYEVEFDGAILSKEWITLNDEQRSFNIPIKEQHRGNLGVHYTFIKDNRLYSHDFTVNVPYTNKELDVSFESFRDKLQPGQQEQWKILIKGKTAEKLSAEMVATLYDESLDVFRFHSWYASFYNALNARLNWHSVNSFRPEEFRAFEKHWNKSSNRYAEAPSFDSFNWFGYSFYYGYYETRAMAGAVMKSAAPMAVEQEAALNEVVMSDTTATDGAGVFALKDDDGSKQETGPKSKEKPEDKPDLDNVKVRTNFNETAFFYPHLETNDKGEIIIKFTVPEALTRWKMLGFAHTADLKSGFVTNQLVTQKDLMVVPNQPRFFRENDKMTFPVKISSLVDNELSGHAQLEFFDALTMKPLNALMKNGESTRSFSLKPRQSANVEWSIEIPEGIQAIMYRVVAKAGNFSDGEEMVLPVVTNRMLVTETLPLPIRGKQTKEFKFEKMLSNKSNTLKHQQFTLEYTSNPAWYAIQALPYLMEYPYECVEQTFSRYYANSIATHIANSNPRIKQVFDTWKNIQPDALLSNLEKNQELKSALLEETPWVLQAQDETQRKRMVGVLFDLNRMANEQEKALTKIVNAQTSSGGFAWFPGLPEDRYMTQHIICGTGHLDVMGVKSVRQDTRTWNMVNEALKYLDNQIDDDYERLKALAKRNEIKLQDNHIGYLQIHYLYMRSYFKDVDIRQNHKEAFDYFFGQAKKYWTKNNMYAQGMISLALHRFGDKVTTQAMIKSFNERALHSEEMGMYWKNEHGYFWYQAPIETQALMIEVYDEVAADTKAVEDLKVWLLKQKQTQDWKTTKATTEACYALLRRGTDALASSRLVEITVGDEKVDLAKRSDAAVEAGTGYFKTAWKAGEIKSNMGNIKVSKSDDGVAWGAAYWQYFEQLDKITAAETPLKLKKDLFRQENTDRGPVISPITAQSPLKVGDLVKVRIELRADRDMEYVHLKDMRAAGFEPVTTISTHRYQDGLYYYESTRDLATNFFIGYLRKGTYVFEYSLRVSQKGDFSNGITTIQCMYAPEFTSHSQGIRVQIK